VTQANQLSTLLKEIGFM